MPYAQREASAHSERSYNSFRSQGSQSPRGRKGKSKGKGKKKGKTKGKEKSTEESKTGTANTIFKPLASDLTPWPSVETTGFSSALPATTATPTTPSPTDLLAQKKECVAALRVAYPEGYTIPPETQELIDKLDKEIDKLEKETNKFVTKNIHTATKALGKAQKTLTETLEARKAHRLRWVKHVTEAVTTWQSQLKEYKKQQATFRDVASKAKIDIETSRHAIQALSSKAPHEALAAIPSISTVSAEQEAGALEPDQEEEKLQTQLQQVLQNCAAALGTEILPEAVEINDLTMESSDMEDQEHKAKRPRSVEPFGGSVPAGGVSDVAKTWAPAV